jgi:hypothetical protein
LGQKQTCAAQKAMSALPPIATAKADIRQPAITKAIRSNHQKNIAVSLDGGSGTANKILYIAFAAVA